MLSDDELRAIEARVEALRPYAWGTVKTAVDDATALLADVKRLRELVHEWQAEIGLP